MSGWAKHRSASHSASGCKVAGRLVRPARVLGRLFLVVGMLPLLGGSLPGLEQPAPGLNLSWETIPARADDGALLGTLVWSALTPSAPVSQARPMLVVFNGGPGAASGWLQLGLLGPLQVSLPVDNSGAAPPAPVLRVADKGLGAQADILFVDPLDTGFSRRDPAVAPGRVRSGPADGAYLARAVAEWLARHGRRNSPVILLGESFGAERAVAVAEHWQRDRPWVRLAGIVMVSQTVLNETDLRQTDRLQAMAMGLPTVAATACHYGRSTAAPRDPLACADAAAELAQGPYLRALRGGAVPSGLVDRLARLTGLGRNALRRASPAIDRQQARLAMLHSQGLALGLYDSRRAARLDDPRGWRDPSLAPLVSALGLAMQRYNQRLLGLARSPVDGTSYVLYNPEVRRTWGGEGPGSAGGSAGGYALADHLGAVLRRSRADLLLASGVFDSVGGYGADRVLADRLALPPGRVSIASYRAGHMLYLDGSSRAAFLLRLSAFVARVGGASQDTPA